MKSEKSKYIARKMIGDEKEGIKEYSDLEKKATGKSKTAIKKILPQEKEHYNLLKKI